MSKLDEWISRQFLEWEMRGRGGRLFDRPVSLEPPFLPFPGYDLSQPAVDDGRRSTVLSRFWSGLTAPPPAPRPEKPKIEEEGPFYRDPEEYAELQLTLPEVKPFPDAAYEPFFHQVLRLNEPLIFELLGTSREIVPQFVASADSLERIERALPQFFPGITALPATKNLHREWSESAPHFAAIELALGQEFMLPLGETSASILNGVVNALEGLRDGELGLYQVLIEPAQNPWEENLAPALQYADGKPIFINRPELIAGTERKLTSAFLAVVVRLVASAEDLRRCWDIVRELAAPFSALAKRGSNYFIPLSNEGYDAGDHEEDILLRASRRTGMLLNAAELTSLLAFPTAAVSRRLRRDTARSHPVPEELRHRGSLLLGANLHAGRMEPVWLTPEHRVRHMHLVGASGTGKSTLLFNLIRQDIDQGQGVAVLDPHGDLVDRVLGIIPPERRDDVVLVDPSDEAHVVGFNILAAHSDFERNLLASDLVSVFRRLSTSWGEQMNSVLRNAILAFLESSRGGTLADLRYFLLDPAYRKEFLTTVTDPDVVFYWERAFPQLTGNKSIGPVQTRLDEFLSRKPIRYMVSQQENRLDFGEILDRGKILLVKLAQGQLGRENANLLGSVIVSKIQQMAMSRQRIQESERRDFWVYLDEFHYFITPSMAEILTGARKYRVGLVLAHQELHQLDADRDVASAVLANCCTRVVFRVSDRDARELESGFAHFAAADLQNLGVGEAICRVGRSEADFNLGVPESDAYGEVEIPGAREAAIRASHARYARPRSEVEAELLARMRRQEPEPTTRKAAPVAREMAEPRTVAETAPPQPPEAAADAGAAMPANAPPPLAVEELPAIPKSRLGFGRGGPEHTAIQQDIKESAEKLGFRAETEKEVLGGAGIVDVSLERDGQKIACEISVTTQADYEAAKFRMCFAAGYEAVIAVGTTKDSVVEMARAIQANLSAEEVARIHVCLPGRFSSVLKRLTRHAQGSDSTGPRSGGYKIKRKYSEPAADDRAPAAEDEILHAIRRALRGE